MAVKNIVAAVPLSSIAASTFSGVYQLVATLPQACFLLRFVNNTSKDITVSYDGTTDHDFVRTLSDENINAQTNAQPQNFCALFPKGTTVWVKAAVGTGSFFVAGYYQPVLGGES